jgi:DNA modification methylase
MRMFHKTKLELTWIGKENRPKLEPRILLEDQAKSYHAPHRVTDHDLFDNHLIFGDNLLALKALEQEFTGKIKCIFIDPPYNTGSAFSHYDDGLEHSLWLSLMRDRLALLRNLLAPEGSLWITIDDNECHYLKVLCDEIFGRQNFIGTVTWQKTTSVHNNAVLFSSATDMLLVYAKDVTQFKMGRVPRSERNLGDYSNPDNDPRGPWASSPLHVSLTSGQRGKQYATTGKSSGLFPILNPLKRVIELSTGEGDWVLDSFAGSGTTGAVAHKMGRRWIMVELGEHCHTHIIPRLKKVIDGEDKGGITEAVGWQGGGGFRYYRLAPSLLEKDKWGNWVINKDYNPTMLAEAVCKLEGFAYAPSDTVYWQHGHSTERDFIYVTTQNLSHDQLQALSDEVGESRSLLVMCAAFRGKPDRFPNLTIKKIPKAVLARCEWGKDDYSLRVENLPKAPAKPGQQALALEPEGAR